MTPFFECEKCNGTTYTTFTVGDEGSCTPDTPCGGNDKTVSIWHTHGGTSGTSDDDFSPEDRQSARDENMPVHLGNPSGEIWTYDPNGTQDPNAEFIHNAKEWQSGTCPQ